MATRETRRIEIELDAELAESLDRIAQERGISQASVLREAARDLVEREQSEHGSILSLIGIGRSSPTSDEGPDPDQVTSIMDLVGQGHGGGGDIAERHDDYLIDAEMAKWKQP